MTTIHIPGDNQTVFDRVCAHLAKQGRRAYVGGGCKYRTPEGLKCAIGGLLADEDCDTLDALDDSQISTILRRGYATAEVSESFLSDLQNAHDSTATHPEVIRNRLVSIAFQYELKPDAANAITDWSA